MKLGLADWPRVAATVARTYGVRGALLRSGFELRRRTARFRATPAHVDGPAPGVLAAFVVDPPRLAAATDRAVALERAERVVAGGYQAFRHEWQTLPREPREWLRHPGTGALYDAAERWWEVRHLDPLRGDIKLLWEPARFGWAYDLVRGYVITGDDRYAAAFHERLADWDAANVPFRGPHWSCGQETAIRAAALLYAEANLESAPSSTPVVMRRLARILAHSAERIDDALGYAISQRNNHGISEAAGLVILGVRFKGEMPEAEHWLARGTHWLERLIPEQFAADGWYIQHSFNYMRVALDQCVVAERALRAASLTLSADAVERLRAATVLLGWVIEPVTGIVPNHGANDGAFVHPVTLADYRDFRPVLTAVCSTFGFALPGEFPADAEVVAWLGVNAPPASPPLRGVHTGESGWAAARIADTAVFMRAGHYRSRPGHSDALHVDIRFGTHELVVDPGTYSYNAPPLDKEFASALVHNGPLLGDSDWGVRGARFLWLLWPDAEIVHATPNESAATIVARVPGRIQRTVRVAAAMVEVEDRRIGSGTQPVVVHWLLHPDADTGSAEIPGGSRWLCADPATAGGWFSPYYGARTAAPFAEVRSAGDLILTRFRAPWG